MKKRTFLVFISGIGVLPVNAGLFDGGGPALATETTQLLNMVKLADTYFQQGKQYATQLQQYDLLAKQVASGNLTGTGSFAAIPSDVLALYGDVNRLYQSTVSLGNSYAQLNATFDKNYGNTAASKLSYSQQISQTFAASEDALKNAALAAGKMRDGFYGNNTALARLNSAMDSAVSAQNQTAVIQANGKFNVLVIQRLQDMLNMMTSQSIALSAYQADQIKKQNDLSPTNAVVPKSANWLQKSKY